MSGLVRDSLTIVIPALNEEEAIGETIRRCLAATPSIRQAADLEFVEIIVVNDGSTDRTSEIASAIEEVKVIDFEKNRGYGAAIKEGFRQGRGTIVGFLDADGTCDPQYFAKMCAVLANQSADVVLGSRMGANSKMPRVRRFGNRLYAFLLGLLCGRSISDTASGMRVIRRASLNDLYPLPDGLHFTPSMSARALLNDLRVIEVPMSYQERIGQSKLNVIRDGVRFLRTILDGLLCYRPETLFLGCFLICAVSGLLLAAYPIEYYFKHRKLEEWMIYRFVVCYLLGSFGYLLLLATATVNRMSFLGRRRIHSQSFWPGLVSALFSRAFLIAVSLLCLITSVVFLWPGIVEYVGTGHVTLHWSRLLAGAFALFTALQTGVFGVLMKVILLWQAERVDGDGSSASHSETNHGEPDAESEFSTCADAQRSQVNI